MELVGAALGHHRNHPATDLAVLGLHAARGDLDLLDEAGGHAAADAAKHAAVNSEAPERGVIGIDSVDQGQVFQATGAGNSRIKESRAATFDHARGDINRIHHVPVQRHLLVKDFRHVGPGGGGAVVDSHRSSDHFHGLGYCAHLHNQPDGGALVQAHLDARGHSGLEPGSLGADAVKPDVESKEKRLPALVGGGPHRGTPGMLNQHRGPGHHRAGRVLDCHVDGSSADPLRRRRHGDRQQANCY